MEENKGVVDGAVSEESTEEDDWSEMRMCPYGANRRCSAEDCPCCGVYLEWQYDATHPSYDDPYDYVNPLDPFGDDDWEEDEY